MKNIRETVLKIINVVGARPNFMKMAPIIEAMNEHKGLIKHILVHTGQHYDERMSKTFFSDLGMPKPDIDLEIGSCSHAEQAAQIMIAFEKVCLKEKPDMVIVVGDVNSTMACTITAKKLGIKVAHVEAGLRSRDMLMPEEINRLCTDVLSDYLFTTDYIANENLKSEGIPEEKIFFVGNVMIDTLINQQEKAKKLSILKDWNLVPGMYATLTLHRPSNVDNKTVFQGILEALSEIASEIPIIFPIHPRTSKMVEKFKFKHFFSSSDIIHGIWITEPLGYLELLQLNMNAKMVLTDSGGLQEETTFLKVPCITLRENTERPITCEVGTNVVVGNDKDKIILAFKKVLQSKVKKGSIPEKWDGNAAERIVNELLLA